MRNMGPPIVALLLLVSACFDAQAQTKEPCKPIPDACDAQCTDCRGDFEASAYVGLAIDTFAGSDTLTYLKPADSGTPHERAIGGFDFAYRLVGNSHPNVDGKKFNPSLWVFGETVHGVRSSDVNCTKNADLPVCQQTLTPPPNPGDQVYYILRNATSLEGFMGFRYEFLSVHRESENPANIYVKAQAGFLDVAGAPGHALGMHHLALGAIATKGNFQDSYLEVGWGRSDVFATAKSRRVKIDGYLERKIRRGVAFFAQLFVDTSLGKSSDAIQTYIGFNFDLDCLFAKNC